jgi:hypothetical protein
MEPLEGINGGAQLIIRYFEKLNTLQKFSVLEEVAVGLLTETSEVTPKSCLHESAISFVYCWLIQEFCDVVSGEEDWGQKVLSALKASRMASFQAWESGDTVSEGDNDPYMGCLNQEKWQSAIKSISDQILWDHSCELSENNPLGLNDEVMLKQRRGSHGAEDRLYALCNSKTHCCSKN